MRLMRRVATLSHEHNTNGKHGRKNGRFLNEMKSAHAVMNDERDAELMKKARTAGAQDEDRNWAVVTALGP